MRHTVHDDATKKSKSKLAMRVARLEVEWIIPITLLPSAELSTTAVSAAVTYLNLKEKLRKGIFYYYYNYPFERECVCMFR